MQAHTFVNCFSLMITLMSVASSSGSPSLSVEVRATSFSRNSSKMLACRKRREPAVRDWLCRVKRIAPMMPSNVHRIMLSILSISIIQTHS